MGYIIKNDSKGLYFAGWTATGKVGFLPRLVGAQVYADLSSVQEAMADLKNPDLRIYELCLRPVDSSKL